MGLTNNDRRASLWPIGWNDRGHIHIGVFGVRLGVCGPDKLVSVGSAVEVCAAFSMVSLDAIISVPSSVSTVLSAICLLASVFSISTRRICMPSVAVSSFARDWFGGVRRIGCCNVSSLIRVKRREQRETCSVDVGRLGVWEAYGVIASRLGILSRGCYRRRGLIMGDLVMCYGCA